MSPCGRVEDVGGVEDHRVRPVVGLRTLGPAVLSPLRADSGGNLGAARGLSGAPGRTASRPAAAVAHRRRRPVEESW